MLLGFAITTAFVPGIIGATVNTSWAVMWLVMPILLLRCKIEVTLIHILGSLFLSYAALSLVWSPHGFLEFMQLLALASVFVCGYTLKDLRSVTIGLSLGLVISAFVAALQYLQVDIPILNFSKFSGLFINPNIYAEVSGLILILLIVNKLWWYIPLTAPGLLVSSRAVVLALGISLAMFTWSKSKLLSVVIIISSWVIALKLSDITYSGGLVEGISVNASSLNIRIGMWSDMLANLSLFGYGIGSFVYVFPEINKHLDTTVSIAEFAHNDLLQLIFELGIGAIPLILIVAYLLRVSHEYRNALAYFLIIGAFGFPLHMPVTGFIIALVAAQLVKFSLGSRTTSDSRGPILFNRMETA